MAKLKRKIFLIVEGARLDVKLMTHLISIYKIDERYEIVPYKTNIYTLYNKMFTNNDAEVRDLLQTLKENEKSNIARKIFDTRYSDIFLVFDLDRNRKICPHIV